MYDLAPSLDSTALNGTALNGTALAPTLAPCLHSPVCPAADSADHEAAVALSRHPEQGWSLLCNGVVLFDDTGELLPDGQTVDPHRPACHWTPAA